MLALAVMEATLLAVSSCTDRKVTPAEGGHPAGTALAQGFQVGVAESVDLLFVVDDSASMLDKQDLLRQALGAVLSTPRCRWDDSGREAPLSEGECPAGAHLTSALPGSTRIGVLSSSLDVGGSDVCASANRRAHLVPSSDGELFASLDSPTFQDELASVLDDILASVGEQGCGYEAPLEVLYRFLVDPEPPLAVEVSEAGLGVARGIDDQLLAERQAFLRPDSLVVAVLLTDEDDCSVADNGSGWQIATPDVLTQLDADHPNLRCFDQERRFGNSFLFPVERYIRGFGSEQIADRAGNIVQNPLFAHARHPSMFRLGAIVGVPWQTLAEGGSSDDAHLIESIDPRPGLAAPDSAVGADPIHGHEYDNPEQSDLQYSCTFPLPEPRDCSSGDPNCDCALGPVSSPNRPLCQAADGSYGTTQYFAKAYPPPRVLEVLGGLASTSFVGSICPKTLDPDRSTASEYGFNAILGGLVQDVLGPNGGIVCLWNDMPLAADGRVECRLIEQGPTGMSCEAPGRSTAATKDVRALEESLNDGDAHEGPASSYCEIDQVAGSPRDSASDAFACANDLDLPGDLAGFCYVNPAVGLGNPELVAQCRSDWQRRFRLAPGTRIRSGARVFAVCDPKFVLD